MAKKTKKAKTAATEAQREKWLGQRLSFERDRSEVNNHEREIDVRYVDGETPLDDRFAKQFGRNMSKWDIPRHNTIRRNLDWVEGYLARQRLVASVVSSTNYNNPDTLVEAEWRQWQVKSVWDRQDYNDTIRHIIRDCVGSGEGIGRVQIVKKMFSDGSHIYVNKLLRRNWRGVWYDSEIDDDTFNNCIYLFDIAKQDAYIVAMNHGKNVEEINNWQEEATLDKRIDRTYGSYTQEMGDMGSGVRKMVYYGQAWWKDYKDGIATTYYAPIIASPDLDKIKFLEPPRKPYNHNEIPYVRLVADRNSRTGLVYSPLTRLRRGQERFLQYPMRNLIRLTQGRQAVVTADCIPKDDKGQLLYSLPEYSRIVQEFIEGDRGVLVTTPDSRTKENFKILENEVLVSKMIELYTLLMSSSETTGMPIDPALLGKSSNINAAVAIQEKAKHAHLSLNRITENHIRLVKKIGHLTLAHIIEYGDEMEFSQWTDQEGTVSEPPRFPDTMMTARFDYNVVAKSRDTGFEEEQIKMIGEFVKVVPQELAAALLMTAHNILPLGNNAAMQDFAKLMLRAGLPVPDGMMTREMKEAHAQMQAAANKEKEEATGLQKADAGAEIEKKQSEAAHKQAETLKTLSEIKDGEKGGEGAKKTTSGASKKQVKNPKKMKSTLKSL